MRQHATIGYQVLSMGSSPLLQAAAEIAYTHHEKFDGSGYPNGLRGDEIPLCGRIVALADVYDALTTARVYKPAYSHEVAKNIILEGNGKHFDPEIVDAFLENEERFIEIRRQLGSEAPEEKTLLQFNG